MKTVSTIPGAVQILDPHPCPLSRLPALDLDGVAAHYGPIVKYQTGLATHEDVQPYTTQL
jgi:hypothetical protein